MILYCTALPLMVNSSNSFSPPHLLWFTAHRLRMTGDFCPLLEVRMRTITQLSLVGGHPSPVRDVTWPSEGDGVMYEAGWQHKVRMATPSHGAGGGQIDRVFAQTRGQALRMQPRLT